MKTTIGLGDLAYYAFRPVVYAIDAMWGTDMRHCEVCAARRKRWNDAVSVPAWMVFFFVTLCGSAIWWAM